MRTIDKALNVFVPTALVLGVAFVGYWMIGMQRIVHDKAINSDALQRVENYGRRVPLGTVVPAHNRWTTNAFIAEASDKEVYGGTSVLILDDHYRGGDPTYRTESGVIGDLSVPLLCSIPSQAAGRGVYVDPAVLRLIHSRCR